MSRESSSDRVSSLSLEGDYLEKDGKMVVDQVRMLSGGKYCGQAFGDADKYPELQKYWDQRYRLWSKFDEGIQMDEEGWYSVTPEAIAEHIAKRCLEVKHDIIVDAFSGCGGNSIQFAKIAKKVIAIDIDPVKLRIARANAKVYGVDHKIEYILGDYTKLLPHLEADIVFLSPPWGGPNYALAAYFDLKDIQLSNTCTYDGISVFKDTYKYVSDTIIYFLPRNVLAEQVASIVPLPNVEIEENIINNKTKSVTAYYGAFRDTNTVKRPLAVKQSLGLPERSGEGKRVKY